MSNISELITINFDIGKQEIKIKSKSKYVTKNVNVNYCEKYQIIYTIY